MRKKCCGVLQGTFCTDRFNRRTGLGREQTFEGSVFDAIENIRSVANVSAVYEDFVESSGIHLHCVIQVGSKNGNLKQGRAVLLIKNKKIVFKPFFILFVLFVLATA